MAHCWRMKELLHVRIMPRNTHTHKCCSVTTTPANELLVCSWTNQQQISPHATARLSHRLGYGFTSWGGHQYLIQHNPQTGHQVLFDKPVTLLPVPNHARHIFYPCKSWKLNKQGRDWKQWLYAPLKRQHDSVIMWCRLQTKNLTRFLFSKLQKKKKRKKKKRKNKRVIAPVMQAWEY